MKTIFFKSLFFTFLLVSCSSSLKKEESFPISTNLTLEYDKNLDVFSRMPLSKLPEEEEINIFFTQAIGGTVGTCGCSMSPMGGADRRYNFYKEVKDLPNTFFFDAGSSLYPSNKDLEKVQEALQYKAHHVSAQDLAFILDEESPNYKNLSPLLLSSYQPKQSDRFVGKKILEVKGLKLALWGLEQDDKSLKKKLRYKKPTEVFKEQLEVAALNIVLNDLSVAQTTKLKTIKLAAPVMLLGAIDGDVRDAIRFLSPSMIHIMGPGHMQQFGHVRLLWNKKTGKIRYHMGLNSLPKRYSSPKNEFSALLTH